MDKDNLLSGLAGFLLGRATAPPPVPPPAYVPPRIEERLVFVEPPVYDEPTARLAVWRPFEPLVDRATFSDLAIPRYPTYGRRWKNEYRAEYLYWVNADEILYLPQLEGAAVPREGPGWVRLRDDPGWGWEVGPLSSPAQLIKGFIAPLPADKFTRRFHPWTEQPPVPVDPGALAPGPGWAVLPADPAHALTGRPWLPAHGFTPWP